MPREAGSRTKIAVWSNDPNVDPVGACVGVNGSRVNAIVDELRGEKIDIINWSDDPQILIENALSPAKVISVSVSEDEKSASVIVRIISYPWQSARKDRTPALQPALRVIRSILRARSQAQPRYDDTLLSDHSYYDEQGNRYDEDDRYEDDRYDDDKEYFDDDHYEE